MSVHLAIWPHLGIADGMPISRVWTGRYSKRPPRRATPSRCTYTQARPTRIHRQHLDTIHSCIGHVYLHVYRVRVSVRRHGCRCADMSVCVCIGFHPAWVGGMRSHLRSPASTSNFLSSKSARALCLSYNSRYGSCCASRHERSCACTNYLGFKLASNVQSNVQSNVPSLVLSTIPWNMNCDTKVVYLDIFRGHYRRLHRRRRRCCRRRRRDNAQHAKPVLSGSIRDGFMNAVKKIKGVYRH